MEITLSGGIAFIDTYQLLPLPLSICCRLYHGKLPRWAWTVPKKEERFMIKSRNQLSKYIIGNEWNVQNQCQSRVNRFESLDHFRFLPDQTELDMNRNQTNQAKQTFVRFLFSSAPHRFNYRFRKEPLKRFQIKRSLVSLKETGWKRRTSERRRDEVEICFALFIPSNSNFNCTRFHLARTVLV